MALSFTKFYCFELDRLLKKHDFDNDTFKWLFLGAAAVVTNSVKADLTEITPAGGYSAGGITQTIGTVSQTLGLATCAATSPSITASGANIGPVYGVALYNDTYAGDPLCWFNNFPYPITILNGVTFPVTFDETNGLYYIS